MDHTPQQPQAPATPPAEKKKTRWLKRLLLSLLGVLALGIIAVLILGGSLFARLAKPGTVVFGEEEPALEEATPAPTPAATPLPGATATPAPTPTPTPEPELPLGDLYPQTRLSDAQLALMASLNADTAQYTNVLLVGVDRRGRSGNSQADVMMIATLDRKNGRLKLTSILRDTFVNIPGYGEYRLNSAAAKGGMPLLLDTINENFHLQLQHYMLVDFSMFERIVDKMGGVTIRMSAAEIAAANDCIAGLNKQRGADYLWDGFIFAQAGNVRCTGKQALGYARIRKIDSDFSRTNRQFKVLTAIFAKFRSKGILAQYDILNELLPLVETNMDAGTIIDCAVAALSMDTQGLLHTTVPIEGIYRSGRVNGSSVLLLDLPMHAWRMHQFIYFNDDLPDEAKVLSAGASLPPRTPSPTLDPALFPTITMLPDGTRITLAPEEIHPPTTEPPAAQIPIEELIPEVTPEVSPALVQEELQ